MNDMIDSNPDNFDDNLIENDDFPEVMEDSFSDDISFDDDDFGPAEETDTFDNFDDNDYATPPQKNGINWFNIGIIGAVILGIAGTTYSFLPGLMGDKQPQQQAQNTPAPVVVPQEPEVSFFDNPDLLNNSTEQVETTESQKAEDIFNPLENAVPSISDSEMEDLFAAIPFAETNIPSPPQDNSAPRIVPQNIDPLPMPSDSSPTTVNVPKSVTAFESQIAEPVINEQIAKTVLSAEIEKINARMDSMNNQMESFMQRLESKIENMDVPSSQTVTVDNSGQINALQQSISKLETRLNATAKQPKPAPIAPTPTPVVTIEEEKKPVVKMVKDVLLPTPTPTKRVSAPKRREPAYIPPKMTYELRGAANGQAVIAQKGTQNLQTVNVGTVVRGLGSIRSIEIENGQWVVRGTSGTVRQ